MKRHVDSLSRSEEHNSRGMELADRGWLEEAEKEFRKAIDLDPRSSDAHANLATVHAQKKRWREAAAEYLTALTLDPDGATAHFNLGLFLSAHGLDMAIEEYRRAIELEPDQADAHLELGLVYSDQGRLEEARAELNAAIGLAPDDPLPHHELAALAMDEGDFRVAIGHLKTVVRLAPEDFDAWLDLGIAYAQKGFFGQAERAYDRARALDGDQLLVEYNRAGLYALWGRPAEAIAALRQAVDRDARKVRGWLRSDPTFDWLRGNPELEALL